MSTTPRKIAILGVLLACHLIAGRFLTISFPTVKIGFTFVPLVLVALLYGPIWCAVIAGIGDFLTAIIVGYGYFPPMTLSAILTGLIFGVLLYKKPISTGRILVCVLLDCILVSLFLQCYWLSLITGKAYLVLLPGRILQNLVMIPVELLVIRAVCYRIANVVADSAPIRGYHYAEK